MRWAEPPAVNRGVGEDWLGSDVVVEEGVEVNGEVGECCCEEEAKGLESADICQAGNGLRESNNTGGVRLIRRECVGSSSVRH